MTSSSAVAMPGEVAAGSYRRNTFSIAAAVGAANLSDNFWVPFLPLFMLEVGARDEANAVFWIALSASVLGGVRLVVGPLWGMLADRLGRKAMFLRALFLTGVCNALVATIGDPWQLPICYAMFGLFSGYNPAAVALTSVSVPDSRMNRSISLITSAQYLGNSFGPVIGSLLIIFLDYRGAIVVGSMFPIIASVAVFFAVPNDRPRHRTGGETAGVQKAEPLPPFKPGLQLLLAIGVYFVIFAMTQLIRLLSPIVLRDLNPENVDAAIGLAFMAGGLASAFSLLALAPFFFRTGQMQRALVASSVLGAVVLLLLSLANTTPYYIAGFAMFSLVQAAMMPAANTLIAANVTRERRGTAFGLASSAHALAFIVGPFGAAFFAGISISLGFVITAAVLVVLGLVLLVAMREPRLAEA